MAEITVNIGDFNEILTLKEGQKTKGDKAQIVTTYIDKATIYADVEVSLADEQTVNDNKTSQQKIIATTYLFDGLNSKWVLEWRGEKYDILAVTPVKGTAFTKITAIKVLKNV